MEEAGINNLWDCIRFFYSVGFIFKVNKTRV